MSFTAVLRVLTFLVLLFCATGCTAPEQEMVRLTPAYAPVAPSWTAELPRCRPGARYLFQAELFRDRWVGGVYAYARAWGERQRLDTHLQKQVWQPVEAIFTCPAGGSDPVFSFDAPHAGVSFRMKNPRLRSLPAMEPREDAPPLFRGRFAIGFYGVSTVADLEAIHRLAANSVILSGSDKNLPALIAACHRLGLAYMLSTPHTPEKITEFIARITPLIRWDRLAFYVADEPEIRSEPASRAAAVLILLKRAFPGIATAMATVRPIGAFTYRHGADYFLSDQYPVPSMPLTWLADSMDEITALAGRGRAGSVIQAFGGDTWKSGGWPRLPTWKEMDVLAMLSVIHRGKAIFFFTWSAVGQGEESRAAMGRVIGRLNHIYPWLAEENVEPAPTVAARSRYFADEQGRVAVQCARRVVAGKTLLLCVNTIRTSVAVDLFPAVPTGPGLKWRELFTGAEEVQTGEGMRLFFPPLGVKALVNVP